MVLVLLLCGFSPVYALVRPGFFYKNEIASPSGGSEAKLYYPPRLAMTQNHCD